MSKLCPVKRTPLLLPLRLGQSPLYGGEPALSVPKGSVACASTGSRDRLTTLLREHGLDRVETVETWPEVGGAPGGVVTTIVGAFSANGKPRTCFSIWARMVAVEACS